MRRYGGALVCSYSHLTDARMAFEKLNKQRSGPKRGEHQTHREHTEAKAFSLGKESAAGLDPKEGRTSFAEIWQDPEKKEVFRNVGFQKHGQAFLDLFAKMQDTKGLNDRDRDLREKIRVEVNYRVAMVKDCQQLLTLDVLSVAREDNHGVDVAIGTLGAPRALQLIRPRILKLASEATGEEELADLRRALQQIHNIYETKKYKKVMDRAANLQNRYGMSATEYRDYTKGDFSENWKNTHEAMTKDLGFFGRLRHSIPHMVRAARVAYTGMKEETSRPMQELYAQREHAFSIINKVLDENFFDAMDTEAYSEKNKKADETLAENDVAEREEAENITEKKEVDKRNEGWERFKTDATTVFNMGGVDKTYADLSPAERESSFDFWNKNMYTRDRQRQLRSKGGWLYRMFSMLVKMRLEGAKDKFKPTFA